MNTSGIKPIGEQILIFPNPVEQTTETGIQLMTDVQLEREELGQTEGVVVALGSKVGEVEFAPGDTVIFNKYSGLLMDGLDEQRYRLIDQKDIRGVFKENENG